MAFCLSGNGLTVQGKQQGECGSGTGLRADLDPAAMRDHDDPGDTQSKTMTAGFGMTCLVGTIETLKDLGHFLGGDPLTVIGNRETTGTV